VNSKLRRTIPIAITVLALPALALAASPQKGKTYIGVKGGGASTLQQKFSIKISSSGKTADIKIYCGTGRAPSTLRKVTISKGRFTAWKHSGSATVWRLTGRFTSSTKATATYTNAVYCGGKSDGTVKLALKTTPN
jgi:hypothetical protein